MEEFLNKYGLIKEEFPDRCIGAYPNRKIAKEIFPYGGGTLPKLKVCVIDKKPIPKVLFAFGSDYNTYNRTRIREIVCIPNSIGWKNNFKHSHSVYQMKKRQEEEKKIEKEKIREKKDRDIKIYDTLLKRKEIVFSYINSFNPYKSKFEISKNGKIYIKLGNPSFKDKKICGTFLITDVTPNLNLGKRYSNYPNDFGGKAKFEEIMCFNFERKPNYINRYNKYEYLFEIVPIDNKLIISPRIKISKYCFHNKYIGFFETENKTYCINGKCYPLQSFLKDIEMNFPKNKNLIVQLPNIECDLWKYYLSPNYVTKLLIIDPVLNEVKNIFYLESSYEEEGNDSDIDEY